MTGITIIDVKIVGICSKHRQKDDEILKDINGRIYGDNEISCIACALDTPVHTSKKVRVGK